MTLKIGDRVSPVGFTRDKLTYGYIRDTYTDGWGLWYVVFWPELGEILPSLSSTEKKYVFCISLRMVGYPVTCRINLSISGNCRLRPLFGPLAEKFK